MDYINANLSGALSAQQLAAEIQKLENVKQNRLKSGENIKSINGQSVVGEGDLLFVEAKLKDSLVAVETLGGIKAGTVFPAGTPLEAILRALFKSTAHFALYFGISKEVPVDISENFVKRDIPVDFLEAGVEYSYTTADGTEEGNYCLFAYPASYGKLSHIYSNDTMIDLIDTWEALTVEYNGDNFFLYYSKTPTKEENGKYQFIFVK